MLVPASAFASGITLGRFGGIYGSPNAEGGLALHWNPARMSTEEGYFLSVDSTLVFRNATYDRVAVAPDPVEAEVNTGLATLSTAAVLPYLGTGYSVGLDSVNLAFGAGIVPGYGGGAEWDRDLSARGDVPGAVLRTAALVGHRVELHDHPLHGRVRPHDPRVRTQHRRHRRPRRSRPRHNALA